MNLPSGKVFKSSLESASTDFIALLEELKKKRFSGYTAISLKGQGGVEEGTLLFDAGRIIGAAYEYYAYAKEFAGEKAFQRILNASASKSGIIDVVELTVEQVHLALAFNEEAVFVPNEDSLKHVKVQQFSPFYEDEVRKAQQAASSEDVGKKYKLYSLTKETAPAKMPQHTEDKA